MGIKAQLSNFSEKIYFSTVDLLIEHLKNDKLYYLSTSHSNIGNKGMERLSPYLKDSGVTVLDISNSHINGNEGG